MSLSFPFSETNAQERSLESYGKQMFHFIRNHQTLLESLCHFTFPLAVFQRQRWDEIGSVFGKVDVMAEGELVKSTLMTRKLEGKEEKQDLREWISKGEPKGLDGCLQFTPGLPCGLFSLPTRYFPERESINCGPGQPITWLCK